MRFEEALRIVSRRTGGKTRTVHLFCGFVPLHLETFLKAHLALRFPEQNIALKTGLFGDLEGNISQAAAEGAEGSVVILEWSDLDQRLGFRTSSGWSAQTLSDIVLQVEEKLRRLEAGLILLASHLPLALAPPTIGLPPFSYLPPSQAGDSELQLNALLAGFLHRLASHEGVRIVSAALLAVTSPQSARHDTKMDLRAGFPYTVTHADALAELSARCLFPASPKKGLITDLDRTLWKGILGDAGVEGISWSLEGKSQAHALYQQVLASLAESGLLVAIASKNDPAFVEAALRRPDLLIDPARIFPIEAGWGPKSESVGRILAAWNIGADSVIFVDDSPMELAEVAEKYPGIECLRFPSEDPGAILDLLWQLRARFGRNEIREEDRLRLASLRASASLKEASATEAPADFLARLGAKVTFESAAGDPRAFELVNKTNQFNLNGIRYTEAEWKDLLRRPGAFVAMVSYQDRFGPLGRIAVLGGCMRNDLCYVDIWVMSCRAFSRQIEFQSLNWLFEKTQTSEIGFQFKPTDRNGPLQTFFAQCFSGNTPPEGEVVLAADSYKNICPALSHQVEDKWKM